MEVLAVIPARGGSKGILRKNLQPVGGVPLLARTIAAARAAGGVSRVVVSTDDEEIAALAEARGAQVVYRPAELASDTASSEGALLHVLETLEAVEGYRPEVLVFLQCTSPFLQAQDIEGTLRCLGDEGADTAFTASAFHHFVWRNGAEGAEGINHDSAVRLRRQDMIPQYLENGAVYAMRVPGFRQTRHRFFGKISFHEMPVERSMEIDSPAELRLANILAAEL